MDERARPRDPDPESNRPTVAIARGCICQSSRAARRISTRSLGSARLNRNKTNRVKIHAISCPSRHATTEEVSIRRPNRASQGKRRSQDWPVLLIATLEALTSCGFKVCVGVGLDGLNQFPTASRIAIAAGTGTFSLSKIPGRCSRASLKATSGAKKSVCSPYLVSR